MRRNDVVRTLAGVALIAVWWPTAWLGLGPWSSYTFFPLWLGYILAIDGLLALRTGTSPIRRAGPGVVALFVASVPLWWTFELLNSSVRNWAYSTPVRYSRMEYALLASLAFSTVVPAVLTTTEMVRSFRIDPLAWLPAIRVTRARLLGVHLAGWLMVGATVLWPSHAFPLVWLSMVFVLDPVATVIGAPSIATFLARRDWSPIVNLGLGTLVCGFFWEMWNVYSMPKWTYDVPYVGFAKVFEMPILGYTGYLPFGLEVYIFAILFARVTPWAPFPAAIVSSRSERDTIDRASGTHL